MADRPYDLHTHICVKLYEGIPLTEQDVSDMLDALAAKDAEIERLRSAAQDVVDRWDGSMLRDGVYLNQIFIDEAIIDEAIGALRCALIRGPRAKLSMPRAGN